jgi:hypothetical protein
LSSLLSHKSEPEEDYLTLYLAFINTIRTKGSLIFQPHFLSLAHG